MEVKSIGCVHTKTIRGVYGLTSARRIEFSINERTTTKNRIESGKIKLLVPHVLIMDLTHNLLPLWIFLGLLLSCVDAVKGIK